MIIALICLICSICININWIYDISCYLGYFLAIYLVTFIAIIPGFQYVFNFVSLLLHKNDKKKSYNKKEEDVTILLPVYNAKKSIEDTINSIKKQKYCGNIYVKMIDDGSTDSSKEVYDKYKDIKEVKIIKQEIKIPGCLYP